MKWQDSPESNNIELDCLGVRAGIDDPAVEAVRRCQDEVRALYQSTEQMKVPAISNQFADSVLSRNTFEFNTLMGMAGVSQSGLVAAEIAEGIKHLFVKQSTESRADQIAARAAALHRALESTDGMTLQRYFQQER